MVAELGPGRDGGHDVGRVDAQHLRQREGHLSTLEGLVVDEGDRVQSDAQLLGDPGDRHGLGAPPDLWVQHQLVEPGGPQPREGEVGVVAAGDRVQHPARVERAHRGDDLRSDVDVAVLEKGPAPDRVVEIPGDALDPAPGLVSAHRRSP